MPLYVLEGHPRKRIYPDGQDADGTPVGESYGMGEPFQMSENDALNLELNGHKIKRVDQAPAKSSSESKAKEASTPAASGI